MHMGNPLRCLTVLLFVVTTALGTAPPKPTIYNILEPMNVVTAGMIAVNNTLNTLQPNAPLTLVSVLKIGALQRHVRRHTNATIAAVYAAGSLNAAESARLADEYEFHDYLHRSMLDNIVRHKSSFATAVFMCGDLSQTIHAGLVEGKHIVRSFAAAAQSVVADGVHIEVDEVANAWDEAIATFETCSGRYCLPNLEKYRQWLRI